MTPGDLHRSRPIKPGKQPYKRKRSGKARLMQESENGLVLEARDEQLA